MPSIAEKIQLDPATREAILRDLAAEPSLGDQSPEALEALLMEVLGVLTGDSPRDEYPRTEVDRLVFTVARPHLDTEELTELSQRIAWLSLWLFTRKLQASAG